MSTDSPSKAAPAPAPAFQRSTCRLESRGQQSSAGTSTPFPDEAKPLEQCVTDPERIIWTVDRLRISKNRTAARLMSQFDVVGRLLTAKQIYERDEMKAAA
ncbi:hypothetical protein DL767_006165 [Monosporascus sp. MG133]|nr:hypothetical protein DL767_006165 [Monosporascus sp. MG133]